MMHKYSVSYALALCAFLLITGSAPAQAQVYVLESTVTNVRVGSTIAMSDRLTVPTGASIRVVMPSGKTQTIKGPYSGTAADLASGQPVNDGVVAWIKNLMATGGSKESTPGATRSAKMLEAPAGFSWTNIPAGINSTMCVQKGARLQLQRASAQAADRLTVVDLTSTERGEVEFAPGSQTAAWPAGITAQDDRTYALLAPDNRPRRQLTLRVLDRLPSEEDILVDLAARGCKLQFDAWVKEKMSGGQRKAS